MIDSIKELKETHGVIVAIRTAYLRGIPQKDIEGLFPHPNTVKVQYSLMRTKGFVAGGNPDAVWTKDMRGEEYTHPPEAVHSQTSALDAYKQLVKPISNCLQFYTKDELLEIINKIISFSGYETTPIEYEIGVTCHFQFNGESYSGTVLDKSKHNGIIYYSVFVEGMDEVCIICNKHIKAVC